MTEDKQRPTRNLAMELVRVTEAAALAAARWMGRGDKEGADGAAVDAMRLVLGTVSMDGIVVIGEGEKDEAPMLYNGEIIACPQLPTTLPTLDELLALDAEPPQVRADGGGHPRELAVRHGTLLGDQRDRVRAAGVEDSIEQRARVASV